MKIEGTLAVAGVGGGMMLWTESPIFHGYAFAAAAFLGLSGINSGVKAMRNYNRYKRGLEGEDAALAALESLPDTYAAVTNFVVPGTKHGDSDLLVVGPFGVLVIEVKTYAGHYACHGDTWFRVHDNGTRQPLRASVSRQLKRNIKAVQHYLVDCEVSAPVHGAIVFRGDTRLDLAHATVPILTHETIAAHIDSLPPARDTVDMATLLELFSPKARNSSDVALGSREIEAPDS